MIRATRSSAAGVACWNSSLGKRGHSSLERWGCRGRRCIAQERYEGEDSEGVGGGPAYQREHHGGSREQAREEPIQHPLLTSTQ